MSKESIGLENIPSEAKSQGGLNDTTPVEQRTAALRSKVGEGAKRAENGSYLPAAYKTHPRTEVDKHGNKTLVNKIVREDR